jgi:hypothetical protein
MNFYKIILFMKKNLMKMKIIKVIKIIQKYLKIKWK